ncbi:MAG: TonB-dependent receptor [Leptolyngbyaceae cyanobacterium CSU_1_3]|nr:TonB-dependent receptor [Leptolyngbyaceae cyanobacterium CSU_1_3]
MRVRFLLLSALLLKAQFASAASASSIEIKSSKSETPAVNIPRLHEFAHPETRASLLLEVPELQFTQLPLVATSVQISQADADVVEEPAEEIIGEEKRSPDRSTPVYVIPSSEIEKQGSDSVAEVLRGLPGFAINDAGFGADIHTGTYYRGASINQSVFMINGRPFGSNISTYHGGTDLNSIPTGAIDRIELSSGTSATLYGSEAIGGVVNIITKESSGLPKLNGLAQFGSFSESIYRGQFGGSVGDLRYSLSYDRAKAENDYRLPRGAANRGLDGRLFNGDTTKDNYFGSFSLDLNARNTLSLDASKITSRRGLLYFGFPLQRDRLDHDAVNAGLTLRSKLGSGEDSTLTSTLAFNQDYFSTYGPTQVRFFRTGKLDSQALSARVEHDWKTSSTHTLRWGVDLKNSSLDGQAISTLPQLARFNEAESRDQFHGALFALNTWQVTRGLQIEAGLRQNFNSQFGSYLNPSVGARWAASPAIAFRGSWVSVHRNPGLDQLYVFDTVHNWQPNPDLDPETGSSWTAGMDVQFARNFTGQFTYFGSRLNDRLGVQAGRWTNIGLVNTNGLEAALRWQVSRQWSTFVNYTYTDAKIETGAERGLQLGLIPFSVGRMGIGYDSNGWQFNLYASYYSGSRRAFFNLPGETSTDFSPSWLNLDLSARIPITSGLGLTIFIENLVDRSYEKVNRIYQPGLTYRIGLQSNF